MASSQASEFGPNDFPKRLHSRPTDKPKGFEDRDELLYRRVEEDHIDRAENKILQAAFDEGLPRLSVNRSSMSEPQDVLCPTRLYGSWRCVKLRHGDIPGSLSMEKGFNVHLVVKHDPLQYNKSHSEIVVASESADPDSVLKIKKLGGGATKALRTKLAEISSEVTLPAQSETPKALSAVTRFGRWVAALFSR